MAPAGSFPANRFGLFDLGGNAEEWCEDWYNSQQKDRVLRGSSWEIFTRGDLLSAKRGVYVPTTRYGSVGFRVVLAPDTAGK